ncbi:methyltransferase domain-containing protein [Hymenobacter busanensis]|uniref:Methyltransferase domain-containing protein n=1 Tax=Hymenobacter busanensis TaxID=2607656 RepID=A0A7L4ZVM2_9BACT|nr:methyltransferase domain-containing protein [Hymenobacter busanensis]KAA9339342.1 methyltransferase domain-containing protein [Hymenobacter busanensis]QHJ06896.1 methyltransferase domain-containing protein [Hymenobacter busanensis]
MAYRRKPAEGVLNIVRFNWPFFAAAASLLLVLGGAVLLADATWRPWVLAALMLTGAPLVASLLVSYYVYDCSALYSLNWLPAECWPTAGQTMVNIHAGFDETSYLLLQRFPSASLRVLDFFDPTEHSEASIRRARAADSPFHGTEPVQPHALPLPAASVDRGFVLLAAHEIRKPTQRVAFFGELRRVLKPTGRLVVVEHLRDPANFLAYTIGFLHFYPRPMWLRTFAAAGFTPQQEIKITPFVSAFILVPNGISD